MTIESERPVHSCPHDLFVRFLFTKGLTEIEEVNKTLYSLGLRTVSYGMFERQADYVASVLPPVVMNQVERSQYDLAFLQWMEELELREIWYGEDSYHDTDKKRDARILYDMLSDPVYALNLNALLTKNISDGDLAPMMNIRFSTGYKPKHISLYKKYFFDIRRMKRADWKMFLAQCSNHEKNVFFTALTEPVENLKAVLGFPSSVSVSDELSRLLRKSLDKANQFLNIGTPETNGEARKWIDTVIKLTDKYQKYRTADSSDFGKALQMEFEYIDTGFEVPDNETLQRLTDQSKKKEAERAEEAG